MLGLRVLSETQKLISIITEPLLNRSLNYSNKHTSRALAYSILLSTLDLLWDTPRSHEKLFPLLVEAINMQPFYAEDILVVPSSFRESIRLFPSSSLTKLAVNGKALSPASSMPSQEESVELWNCFVSKCTEDETKFSFWFDLLKTLYLPVYCSQIIKELSIESKIPVGEGKRFRTCPPAFQEVLASGLAKWLRADAEDPIFLILCPGENFALLMAICRDMCLLPLEFATTTARIIEKFRELLFVCVSVSP